MIAVYVSIGVSGGHLNPAVTLAMAFRGKMKWLLVCHSCVYCCLLLFIVVVLLGNPVLGVSVFGSFYVSSFCSWNIQWSVKCMLCQSYF